MLDHDFTLQNYMQEISPIVEEIEAEKELVRSFEDSLHQLRKEAMRCNDNFTIYLAWQDNIARKLEGVYSSTELLELHGFSTGTIVSKKYHHAIVVDEVIKLEFYLCNHQIYTPLGTSSTLNQCLRCV